MITITLPWPDKNLSPNSRVHWRKKADAVRTTKELGYMLARQCLDRVTVLRDTREATYIFHPPDRRRRDIDNCHSMCKAYQDGVCSALGIDDNSIRRTVLEWGEVVKDGKVVLRLEELD